MISYLLDANVFIGAKNLHYGLDFCPAFWDWIVANNASGLVFSIEKVGDEVQALADELSLWAGARGPDFFLRPDAKVFPALAAVSIWATGQRYEPSAVSTFLQVAIITWLLRRSRAAYGRQSRGSLGVDAQDQNTRRMHRPRYQVYDAVRDASARAGATCSRATGMTANSDSRG